MNQFSFISILLILTFISCSANQENDPTVDGAVSLEEGYTPHPQPDNLPHPDVEPVVLELRDGSEVYNELPETLQLLHSFLSDTDDTPEKETMSAFVSTHHSFHAASIDSETIIMLDEGDERLIQYDLIDGDYTELAPRGRGPGDIMFTKEMQIHNDKIFVGMQGFRISIFDCRPDTCEYERTINTEYNNYSLAPSNEQIGALGIPPFGSEVDSDPENIDQNIIHILDFEGEHETSFSRVYQHRSPILREAMNSGGSLRVFPPESSYVLTHNFFPFLYLYNLEGEFLTKFQIPEFQQGYYDHSNVENRGRYRHNDNTNIAYTTKINNEWLLLHLRNRRGMEWEEDGLTGDEWTVYYAFNVKSQELYNIGEDDIRQAESGNTRGIFPTEHGIVVNENGELYWIGL